LFLETSKFPFQKVLLIGGKEKVLPFVLAPNFEITPLGAVLLPDRGSQKDLIGGVHLGSKSILLYSNSKKSDFVSITIDHETKKSVKSLIGLKKGEVFLESFALNTSFFIVTTFWDKSTINFYEISSDKNFVFHELNLNDFKLREKNFFETLLRETREPEFTKVAYETINSLEGTNFRNKLYYFHNTCFVTLDYDGWRTYVFKINLNDWTVTLKKIGNLKSKNVIKSNSFLFFNELFRSELTNDSLRVSIFDLESGKLKTEFLTSESDDIPFKNSPIIQEGGGTIFSPDERELNRTKALFRKITNGDMAISVYRPLKQDSAVCMTVGSVKTIKISGHASSFGSSGVSVPGSGGGFVSTPTTFNPTYNGYQNYSWSKSAYFHSTLSKDLKHVSGSVNENDFDKMKKYLDDESKNIPGTDISMGDVLLKTIFQSEQKFYAAIYSKSKGKLLIMRP
ncbi:MAG: hypothetical protein ACKO96_19535, partial [Flammeovirgaceae bacterium]